MFKTGTKVVVKDPTYFDEEINGFVAKQLDENHFLVRLERPFSRQIINDGKLWLKVRRDFAHQVVREI